MPPPRARVAIAVTYGLSVRYLLPTGLLARLAEVCDPVVAIGWDDPDLVAWVEREGGTAARLPDPRMDHEFRRLQRLLEPGFERRLASPTTTISRRWRRRGRPWTAQLPTRLRQARDRAASLVPGADAARRAEEATAVDAHTNVAEFAAWLAAERIDAVVSMTPYHQGDQLLLWAAAGADLPAMTSIISFDNPTTRGRLPVLGDRIAVWNASNQDQVLRAYDGLRPEQVPITGAPQFDLHRDSRRVLDEETWRRRLGLPAERPVVLYGAGPNDLLPDEPTLVALLDEAITAGRVPGDPVIVLRGHPADPTERWSHVRDLANVVLSPGWGRADGGRAWPSDDEVDVQMSTLAHAAVQVSICSSMAVDGAAFDRPVVVPTFLPGADRPARRTVRAFYRQEHWQPIARSGGVAEAATIDQLVAAIDRGLRDPAAGQAGRARMVADVLTYDDGRSSERVAAVLAELLAEHPLPSVPNRSEA